MACQKIGGVAWNGYRTRFAENPPPPPPPFAAPDAVSYDYSATHGDTVQHTTY